MKPLSPVEKTFLSFSLCVVAGMALVQCTPAHAGGSISSEPHKTLYLIDKSVFTQSDVLGYSAKTHKSSESGLAVSYHLAQMPRLKHAALFCVSFSTSVMVRLDGDTFGCASFLDDLSANPVQSDHLHLAVNDSTSINLGVTNHAI
jgi:hypothetical protein